MQGRKRQTEGDRDKETELTVGTHKRLYLGSGGCQRENGQVKKKTGTEKRDGTEDKYTVGKVVMFNKKTDTKTDEDRKRCGIDGSHS